jgi:hypothetical protein
MTARRLTDDMPLTDYTWRDRFDARAVAFRLLLDLAEQAHTAAQAQIAQAPGDHVATAQVTAAAAQAMRAVVGAVRPGD